MHPLKLANATYKSFIHALDYIIQALVFIIQVVNYKIQTMNSRREAASQSFGLYIRKFWSMQWIVLKPQFFLYPFPLLTK